MWFVSIFSLIVVMFTVYTTIPKLDSELPTTKVNVTESNIVMALKVKYEEDVLLEISNLQQIMLDETKTAEEKNNAYNELKGLNQTKAIEEQIENMITKKYNLDSFAKMKYDQIEITINSSKHSYNLANKIMNEVQALFEDKKYICIKFKS